MITTDKIIIRNAHVHNLKNINVEIPKKHIVVFTGVSGSGKSSLVFDTVYTEAQRQLIETFSSFARSRMPKLSRPDVDEIKNLSTAIVIDQKRMGHNLRSTVGTATEINTYLRLLYSRCGDTFIGPSFLFGFNHPEGMCAHCQGLGKQIKVDVNKLINWKKSIREGAINHPDYKVEGWNWREMLGIQLFDVDKKLENFSEKEIDDLLYADAISVNKKHGGGIYTKNYEGIVKKLQRLHLSKAEDELSEARKNAYHKYFVYSDCESCSGTRLNERARSVLINGKNIAELTGMELIGLGTFLSTINSDIARPMVSKTRQILSHLIDIGVGYLSLSRPVSTLSGGESQRVKMARQLDCDLVDMMYILDEPSVGLHPKDGDKLIQMLAQLKNKGNSVFVVEHDPDIIRHADYIVDIGPGAGIQGGKVMFSGTVSELMDSTTTTAKYLKQKRNYKKVYRKPNGYISIENAAVHNLKNVSLDIPTGIFVCVTGVAGSGKSSLIHDVFCMENPGVILVDQSPVGRSSRSNSMTYVGVFDSIRKIFSSITGKPASLFSFNSDGACPKCKGLGEIKFEMNFLDDVKMVCDECNGKRYTEETLKLTYKGKNIFDVLEMSINQAINFFEEQTILRKLDILQWVGLGYLKLGQSLSTLSGGEAQRIKLASELHKNGNVYVMDEPTSGLHMADIERLMNIVNHLVEQGNSVLVIEHNLDVISQADWIIDLGPEGGNKGGNVIFQGTPDELIHCPESYTGKYLKKILH